MGAHWKSVRLGLSTSNLPPVIIKREFDDSSYTVYFSDLTNLWTEHLTAKAIRRKALNAGTSIDPSEDPEQMRLFLRGIDNALEQKQGTDLTLLYDVGTKSLLLRTHTALPGSLEPLRWTIELKIEPCFVLTREMIIPLLRQQAILNVQSASLIQQLKEKDHMIDKLINSMQADGISLSTLFPGAATSKSAMKTHPRQALSKHARGLSAFDEEQWRRNLTESVTQSSNLNQLVHDVFQTSPLEDQEFFPVFDYGEWWLSITNDEKGKIEVYGGPESQVEDIQAITGDSQFQKQLTPPKLPRRARKQTPELFVAQTFAKSESSSSITPAVDASTTDEDDDLVALTAFKSAKPAALSHANVQNATIPGLTVHSVGNGSKSLECTAASIGSDGHNYCRAENSKSDYDPGEYKTRAKIGKIGGRARTDHMKISEPFHPTVPFEQAVSERESGQTNTSDDPLPKIPPVSVDPKPSNKPQKSPDLPSPAQEEGESENERADRNRERIKRALEAKAATPAKKKRRF